MITEEMTKQLQALQSEYWEKLFEDFQENPHQYLFTQHRILYMIHPLFGVGNNITYTTHRANIKHFFVKDLGFMKYNHLQCLGICPWDKKNINSILLSPDNYYAFEQYYQQNHQEPNMQEILDILKNGII